MLGALAAAVLALAFYQWIAYLRLPDRMIERALNYLRAKNIEGLLSLASERERRLLNLTPESVRACLQYGYWQTDPANRFSPIPAYPE
ncbi:MAG: hypothetical protein RMJ43_12540 [Chloroherpetonaceae bacterium]|nr:hypothetical protein [Chthonomonadaceae bacterium]MDW8208657.1 hypothetical protein [Chloroherpetonaceae bacterium]